MASEFVDPLLDLFTILLAARLAGWTFQKARQPSVIGEVLGGIVVGPSLLGLVYRTEVMDFVAELGAVFLLFLVGVETRLDDILSVGEEALLVASLGVIVPFLTGWGFGRLMGWSTISSLFVGTALVATSVGITARVLQELEVLTETYSRIILGAAVIDDVLGLVLLAIVSGMAASGGIVLADVGQLLALSVVFVALSLAAVPAVRRLPVGMRSPDSAVRFGVLLGVGMAGLAAVVGLAPIVGAFFAGMIVAEMEVEFEVEMEEPIHGITVLLTPVFFGVVGLNLDLAVLSDPYVLGIGGALTAIAVVGKLVGGLGALGRGFPEASLVGMGMVPRGEVGLIVAALGLSAGAVDASQYAIVLVAVLATTLLAPLVLRPLVGWVSGSRAGDREPG